MVPSQKAFSKQRVSGMQVIVSTVSFRHCSDWCKYYVLSTSMSYYAPPLICGALSDALSDVGLGLSVAYIGPKSRTERPRKTKIGTEVAHVTRVSDTIFKVKRSRPPGRFAHRRVGGSGGCSDGRGNVLAVGNCCYIADCSAAKGVSAPTGG